VVIPLSSSDGADQIRVRSQLFYKFNKSVGYLGNAHSNGSNDKSSDNDLYCKAVHDRFILLLPHPPALILVQDLQPDCERQVAVFAMRVEFGQRG
jgi:hypothetical protein